MKGDRNVEQNDYRFDDFLKDVHPAYQAFVRQTNDTLLENGYKMKMEMAKSGFVVSYLDAKTKRTILNFVFRKSGLVIRIYGEHVNGYLEFMETLPDMLAKTIDSAPICKRLVNPLTCNSRCPMGYDFVMKGKHHQKCRYSGFMFPIDDESVPYIEAFIANELRERSV